MVMRSMHWVLGATRPARGAGGAVDPVDHSALAARDKRSGAVL
ncbi:hypothetical protein [Sorangium cellulosum]